MALNKIFQNPKLNNIQFVEQGAVLNPKYNNLPIDKEWYYENILSYQFQQKYFQPVRQGDLIWLEFHRTDTNGVGIDIVSCSGDILETVYATNQVAVEGHTYEGEQLHTSSIRFLFSDYDLPNGYYYLRPFADFYDGETLIERLLYISEPLDVREEHPDTVLLECYNFSNKQDFIFYNSGLLRPACSLRVHGYITDYNVDDNLNSFKEQNYEQRTISRTAWRNAKLFVGSKTAKNDGVGIPFYMCDKVNEYLSCDVVNAENRRYSVDEGSKLELEKNSGADNYPLYNGSIGIREYDKEEAITLYKNTLKMVLLPAPPYSIYQLAIGGTQWIPNLIEKYLVPDLTAQDDLVDFLNEQRAVQYGQGGTYSVDGDNYLVYNQAKGENYFLFGQTVVCDKVLDLTINIPSNGDAFQFALLQGYANIDMGDDTYQENHPLSPAQLYYHYHEYAASGNYTVRIYHNGQSKSFLCDSAIGNVAGKITNISGDMPLFMETIYIRRQNFSGLGATGLSLDFIANCKKFLKLVEVSNSQLQGFDGTVFLDNKYTFTNGYWLFLTHCLFNGNAFTVSEVNSFLNDFYDNTPVGVSQNLNVGTINLIMSPSAAPTGTALTKRNAMFNAGWNMLNN